MIDLDGHLDGPQFVSLAGTPEHKLNIKYAGFCCISSAQRVYWKTNEGRKRKLLRKKVKV